MSNKKYFTNWSQQYRCQPDRVHYPASTAEIIESVNQARQVRVFGSGHSPSDIAMSNRDLIVLDCFNKIIDIDLSTETVLIQGGVTLKQLNSALAARGLALPNLGSISEQTVAGAMATATHGTGLSHGVLSTLIIEMTLINAFGKEIKISSSNNQKFFDAAKCHLGALGIVTELKLKVCKAFDLEVKEQPNDLETVLAELPERLKNDYYRFWYLPHVDRVWEWAATRQAPTNSSKRLQKFSFRRWYEEKLIGYHTLQLLLYIATYKDHLIPKINRWYADLMFAKAKTSREDSVSQFNFDCLFKQYVNEWSIPIERTAEAIMQIRQIIVDCNYKVHLPIEVRFVAKDDIWLSPCQGRDSCYIGVISYLPYGKKKRL